MTVSRPKALFLPQTLPKSDPSIAAPPSSPLLLPSSFNSSTSASCSATSHPPYSYTCSAIASAATTQLLSSTYLFRCCRYCRYLLHIMPLDLFRRCRYYRYCRY